MIECIDPVLKKACFIETSRALWFVSKCHSFPAVQGLLNITVQKKKKKLSLYRLCEEVNERSGNESFLSFQIPSCDRVCGEGSGIVSPVDFEDILLRGLMMSVEKGLCWSVQRTAFPFITTLSTASV